jgi:hypothetical protein
MYSLGSYLTKKEAEKVLRKLEEEIGEDNVGVAKAGYLANLLNFSAIRGYSSYECLEIINS